MNPVLTKTDFARRYKSGEFGNGSPTWDNPTEFLLGGVGEALDQLYHLRNRVKGGPTYYDLERRELLRLWGSIANPDSYYVSAMCPTHLTIIQGEVSQVAYGESYKPAGIGLYYSTVAKPMRAALEEDARQVYGIEAVTILRHYFNARSYEWLQVLFDRYPGHVVEFTTLSTCWGTLPGFNVIFWEVRNY